MRARAAKTLIVGTLLALAFSPQRAPAQMPTNDVIPNEAAALRVALAIMEGFYGEKLVRSAPGYKVFRQNDDWVIIPDLPSNIRGGGLPEMVISGRDGRVRHLILGR